MAEENLDELLDAEEEFKNKFFEAATEFDEYFGCPQLTCGQFTRAEVRRVFDMDLESVKDVRPSEYETFTFFSNVRKKFAQQIDEYKEMKAANPSMTPSELRQKYLDDNNYAEDSLARICNPFWKFDPDLD